MCKISIIVPVYNMETYLGACLDSVLSQTLREIEVIAVNDGSTDRSPEILNEYAQKDSRIRIIDKKNEGVGAARNDGIRAARGEFLAFMDSDDLYAKEDILEHCYETALRENVPVVGGQLVYLEPDGRKKLKESYKVENQIISASGLTRYADYQFDYGYTCFIFRREMIVSNQIFFPLYGRFQDPPFFVRTMIAAKTFYQLPEPMYVYRRLRENSKCSASKTVDFLRGVTDNLIVSREHGLAKLHYISVSRLNKDGYYLALQNLYGDRRDELLAALMRAWAAVDTDWLKAEGYPLPEPFVPEIFRYLAGTAGKYEKIRSSKLVKAATWLPKKIKSRKK